MTIVNSERYKYPRNGARTTKNRMGVDNGDALAVALRGMTIPEIRGALVENGVVMDPGWENLNQGMQRMIYSNIMRGVVRREGSAKVKGEVITRSALTQN